MRRLLPPLLLAAVPALAADPVSYTVRIAPTGNGALDGALAGTSQLVGLRGTAPAGPFALIARARADQARLHTALESFGYYDGHVAITIAGAPLDDAGLPDRLAALPGGVRVAVAVAAERGPLFHLRTVTLAGDVPARARAAFELRPGAPAVASDVLAAGGRLRDALAEDGYALAIVASPDAVLVPSANALDVTYRVRPGPRIDIGAIRLSGLKAVDPAFVRRRLLVHPGQLYQPSKIEAARQDLASLPVFSAVRVRHPDALDTDGRLPLDFDFSERLRHAVTFTVAYSTDLGASAGVTWSDRNLFGQAEQLNLSASLTGAGGSATKGVGYDVTAQLLKPDVWRRDQTLEFDLAALKQNLEAYDQTAETAGVILTRKLSTRWTVSGGISAEQERILQEGVTRDYTLFSVPLTARYDGTGLLNPLDDPTHGARANLAATPTESLGGGDATFVVLQVSGSAYFDFASFGWAKPGRSVLAVRGLVGSAQGASEFSLPPDQRFYGGGTATLRGFRYQSVGPLFPDGNPVGGQAIDAGSVEFRQRIGRSFGAVAFVDAGQVSARSAPFEGTLREGIGAGARYYTSIGPIRLDVAVPVNRPPKGDSFELYIGLGQAF